MIDQNYYIKIIIYVETSVFILYGMTNLKLFLDESPSIILHKRITSALLVLLLIMC